MIKIDLNKAKEIVHDVRRVKREELFKPLDIEATIPMFADDAEQKRQAIRDEYVVIQNEIDNAETVDQLKAIITQLQADR